MATYYWRCADQGGSIPAIALTSYADDYDQKQAIASEFQQELSKPVEPDRLVRTITEVRSLYLVSERAKLN